jgi:hypothetical protein
LRFLELIVLATIMRRWQNNERTMTMDIYGEINALAEDRLKWRLDPMTTLNPLSNSLSELQRMKLVEFNTDRELRLTNRGLNVLRDIEKERGRNILEWPVEIPFANGKLDWTAPQYAH